MAGQSSGHHSALFFLEPHSDCGAAAVYFEVGVIGVSMSLCFAAGYGSKLDQELDGRLWSLFPICQIILQGTLFVFFNRPSCGNESMVVIIKLLLSFAIQEIRALYAPLRG